MTENQFQELETRLGHRFHQIDLLQVALTHRSFHFENKSMSRGHFERLEFLGDAVLDLLLSEALMRRYPLVDEGTLSKWRASLVNETSLGEIGRKLDLSQYLFLGKSEVPLRANLRPRLLGSAFEAVVAALYLDSGLENTRAFIEREFGEMLGSLNGENQYATDFKTRLQEWTQKNLKVVPEYRLLAAEGPEHAKTFRFEVLVNQEKWGEGEGGSRKIAEQAAARIAMEKRT
ncbi:MAG TPA: ribonuclease III [Bdellovibrionales bacterium]|nr:ribonuclease III [Bdellovibrionales bacterium]